VARLETSEQAARKIAALVSDHFAGENVAVSSTDAGDGRWGVAIHFRVAPDQRSVRALVAASAGAEAAKALHFDRLPATEWVRESLAGLVPVDGGRFVVHGAHDRTRIPLNRLAIEIEAALAFGTGHHGSTRGCLLALDRLCKVLSKRRAAPLPCKGAGQAGDSIARCKQKTRPSRRSCARHTAAFKGRESKSGLRILDLGTGSGVLAIAAARALRRPVLATDIDANAVRAARANARVNRAGALVEVVRADGIRAPQVHARAPFDLAFGNVLLGPLLRFAFPLRRLIASGGRIVLSGLLPPQANAVIAAYRPLALERRITLDGWTTLVFARRTRRRRAVARLRQAS